MNQEELENIPHVLLVKFEFDTYLHFQRNAESSKRMQRCTRSCETFYITSHEMILLQNVKFKTNSSSSH